MEEDLSNLDKDIIWSSTDLMQTAVELSVYRYTLAFSLGNLVLVVLLTGSILILQMIITSTVPFILAWILLIFGALGIHLGVFRHVIRRVDPMKYEYQIWGSTYFLIFFIGYFVNTILNNFISPQILWYPLLGLANLIIGLSIEHFHYSKKELFARPILFYSICLLVTTPLLLIPELQQNTFFVSVLALILASLNTSYSIAQAEKKVVNT
ncbi:MAG: hypothetical protein ACXAC8_11320 [Candidatus Hodarchaeales archaeon]|jgi:hypothetical protein